MRTYLPVVNYGSPCEWRAVTYDYRQEGSEDLGLHGKPVALFSKGSWTI